MASAKTSAGTGEELSLEDCLDEIVGVLNCGTDFIQLEDLTTFYDRVCVVYKAPAQGQAQAEQLFKKLGGSENGIPVAAYREMMIRKFSSQLPSLRRLVDCARYVRAVSLTEVRKRSGSAAATSALVEAERTRRVSEPENEEQRKQLARKLSAASLQEAEDPMFQVKFFQRNLPVETTGEQLHIDEHLHDIKQRRHSLTSGVAEEVARTHLGKHLAEEAKEERMIEETSQNRIEAEERAARTAQAARAAEGEQMRRAAEDAKIQLQSEIERIDNQQRVTAEAEQERIARMAPENVEIEESRKEVARRMSHSLDLPVFMGDEVEATTATSAEEKSDAYSPARRNSASASFMAMGEQMRVAQEEEVAQKRASLERMQKQEGVRQAVEQEQRERSESHASGLTADAQELAKAVAQLIPTRDD